ncbi:MAG: mannose-1-phosphate guanylyltransferase [bacterium]
MTHAIIMAGGVGTRFWPRSRKKKPKQLLNILGKKTLIQETVTRISPLVAQENILIVTTKSLAPEIRRLLPQLQDENFVIEPVGRNTAPCIGLAALKVTEKDPDGIMVVLPADHLISDVERFLECLRHAIETVKYNDAIVTLGIHPTHPETGYGYIQYDVHSQHPTGAYNVKTFAEKPYLDTAKLFLASGDFLWNSGIFIWSVQRILREIEQSMPDLHSALNEIRCLKGSNKEATLESIYHNLRPNSIDYGVMERATNVAVVKGDFYWTDVGSWAEVYKISPKDENGNVNLNNHIFFNSRDCYVVSEDRFVVMLGVKNLIVVNTPDALLICHRDSAQDVKLVVEHMERQKINKYL